MAYEQLKHITQDKEFLRAYHRREMAMSDWTTGIDTATEKGIEIGTKQGIEIGKIEDAKKMLSKGLALDLIREITGLDEDKIKSLHC
jgi:predicted transposase/invertase (TIGR01784 family)